MENYILGVLLRQNINNLSIKEGSGSNLKIARDMSTINSKGDKSDLRKARKTKDVSNLKY